MEYLTGCLICGGELIYSEHSTIENCCYCGVTEATNVGCSNGHFVCDACHNNSANDLIERYCGNSDSTSPLAMALALMRNPALKMHGPEHHFLVPAVLLASYFNQTGITQDIVVDKIRMARQRAEDVKGGFCGLQGACGAAIGAGIFVSVMTGATPLADRERRLSNLMTAECLKVIAENGGPRCCKREVLWTLKTAIEFAQREFGIILPVEALPPCSFSNLNKECIRERCRFNGA
jgi:hypothetical protein